MFVTFMEVRRLSSVQVSEPPSCVAVRRRSLTWLSAVAFRMSAREAMSWCVTCPDLYAEAGRILRLLTGLARCSLSLRGGHSRFQVCSVVMAS